MIDEKVLVERLEEEKKYCSYHPHTRDETINKAIEIVNQLAEESKGKDANVSSNNGWIPFKQREMTEEEKEFYGEDLEYMLDCKLPDDDEEILVSYKNGYVDTDTFIRDSDGCYLDSGSDFIDDAIAWQPLPAPFKPKK